jgi:CheY-like chemotaxis protein
MKIHEYQGKEILRSFGVPVPRGIPAFTVQEAVEAAQKLSGPVWVVKAQIHAGGRGKGGGVKLAKSVDDVKKLAGQILSMQLKTHQTGPEGQKVRRLYIEDGADYRRLVRHALQADGYDMLEAEDGLAGIQVARAEQPDLILMDMELPDLTGLEVTTRLRSLAETRDVPIVALTASMQTTDRERCLAAGCNGFLNKPIGLDELRRQVGDFLAGKREVIADAARWP